MPRPPDKAKARPTDRTGPHKTSSRQATDAIVTDSTDETLLDGASFPVVQDVAAELAVLDSLLDATGLLDSGRDGADAD